LITPDNSVFRVLSIDGGGIRGAYPAAFLSLLADKLEHPIYKYFDLICGTSTGGLVALALSLDIAPRKILDLYEKRGPVIFGNPRRFNYFNWLVPKYDSHELESSVKKLFGERILGEALTRVCVPTSDATVGKTTVFKTRHDAKYRLDHLEQVWKIAMATSAAPGYLPAFDSVRTSTYVDGGLWANNPALIGVIEGIKLGHPISDIRVLSIGTGLSPFHIQSKALTSKGLGGWGLKLVDFTFRLQSDSANNICKHLCQGNFHRIDPSIPADFKLDNCDAIPELVKLADPSLRAAINEIMPLFFQNPASPFYPIP
jgi:patatin-like phospholipase/acyl hydrolase